MGAYVLWNAALEVVDASLGEENMWPKCPTVCPTI